MLEIIPLTKRVFRDKPKQIRLRINILVKNLEQRTRKLHRNKAWCIRGLKTEGVAK